VLQLSLSCGVYDRTLPLLLGMVTPEGIELDVGSIEWGRGMGSADADIYEAPLVGVIMRRAREDTIRALPIYPKRTFFQQLVLAPEDSPIRGLADLRGKRVGVLNWYQHAMGVWLRGYLLDAFGIRPEEIDWTTGRPNSYPMPESSRVRIDLMPQGVSLVDLLLEGQIDALVHEQAHSFLREHAGLRRVLPDHREHEAGYYRETGCFPINHVLVVRKALADAEPWIAGSLLRAFEESKEQALSMLHRNNAMVSVAWMDDLLEEQEPSLGPDPFPYGLEGTRHEVERLVRHMVEQELIPAPLAIEEIFADASA
jgi:4,5-dihydroxyphthalate decarboxylase